MFIPQATEQISEVEHHILHVLAHHRSMDEIKLVELMTARYNEVKQPLVDFMASIDSLFTKRFVKRSTANGQPIVERTRRGSLAYMEAHELGRVEPRDEVLASIRASLSSRALS